MTATVLEIHCMVWMVGVALLRLKLKAVNVLLENPGAAKIPRVYKQINPDGVDYTDMLYKWSCCMYIQQPKASLVSISLFLQGCLHSLSSVQ